MSESDKPDELDKADELDILDEQKQQELQARIAQKRLDLSQSVEETLADTSLLEDDWLDEEDELDLPEGDIALADESEAQANVKDTTLIPPRLSLQSKPMPAVRLDTAPHPSVVDIPGNALAGQAPPPTDVINHVPTQASNTSPPADVINQVPSQLPGEGQSPPPTDVIDHVPTKQSTPRLAGRTTRVLLKAIGRSEGLQAGEVGESSVQEMADTSVGQAESGSGAEYRQVTGAALFGSGVFRRGQGDVVIDNPLVSRSSVVVVMLTSDAGHVVVQYVSLIPGAGFTVHLSASAEREAGFNYVILTEE